MYACLVKQFFWTSVSFVFALMLVCLSSGLFSKGKGGNSAMFDSETKFTKAKVASLRLIEKDYPDLIQVSSTPLKGSGWRFFSFRQQPKQKREEQEPEQKPEQEMQDSDRSPNLVDPTVPAVYKKLIPVL